MPSLFKRRTGKRPIRSLLSVAAGGIISALLSSPLTAAEVTFDRLKNAESEPGNWLTTVTLYDSSPAEASSSTLDTIWRMS